MPDPEAPPAQHALESANRTASLLALETATSPGGVALLRGDGSVVERALTPGAPTSESLLPAIDALLRETGVGLAELGGFAVSIGPGSFTGLRVGVATVKGLAFGAEQPIAPVPTLAALACAAPPADGPVVALLDARRGEVYAAGYAAGPAAAASTGAPDALLEGPFGVPDALLEGLCGLPDALPEGLYDADSIARRLPASCRLVGEGVATCGSALRERIGPGVRLLADVLAPRAADVARIGAALLARGESARAEALAPRYVRRAEAEVRRTGLATEAPC